MTTVFTLPAFSYLVDISSDKSLQIIPVRQDFDIYSFRRGFRSPTPAGVLHPETRRGRHAQTHLQGTGLESVKTGEYFLLVNSHDRKDARSRTAQFLPELSTVFDNFFIRMEDERLDGVEWPSPGRWKSRERNAPTCLQPSYLGLRDSDRDIFRPFPKD